MNTHTHTLHQPGAQPSWADRLRHSKALLPTLAVLGVTVLALAAALVSSRLEAQHGSISGALGVPASTAPVESKPLPPLASNGNTSSRVVAQARPPAPVRAAQPVCTTCGVVESVTTVQRQGRVDGIGNSEVGLGAIGGAVVGGILGNQVGGGSGKKAATVLGAAGGAYAGHQIEKNSKKVTVYQVRVRMNDGTVRTVEQGTSVAAGTRVVVEGGTVRVANQAG